MKYLITIFLLLLCLTPIQAQEKSKKLPVAPCLPTDAVKMQIEWMDTLFGSDIERGNLNTFYLGEGTPIKWLGYAPKGQESKEWYGVEYGFGGVNMFYYGQEALITFYNADKELVGRIEVHYYKLTDEWILYFTTTYQYGRSDGSRYSWHIPAYPNTQGKTSCMFFMNQEEFNQAMGYKE